MTIRHLKFLSSEKMFPSSLEIKKKTLPCFRFLKILYFDAEFLEFMYFTFKKQVIEKLKWKLQIQIVKPRQFSGKEVILMFYL